ncbi:pancreatic triacylglycerol lipase-like [Brevipalpus obovatus]|uniref:pancreatic triacylglycerol lipase-like n=1 Tax=Brevipalpus obovatus TaxID=246614 RepID=UPI003D9EB92E
MIVIPLIFFLVSLPSTFQQGKQSIFEDFEAYLNSPTSDVLPIPCFKRYCYEDQDIGCFDPQALELIPILPPVPVCPHSPEFIQTKFQVYYKNQPNIPLPISQISTGTRLAICVHGYTPSSNSSFTQLMKDTILRLPDIDACMAVDWDRGAKSGVYYGSKVVPVEDAVVAAVNLQLVGRIVARTLYRLHKSKGVQFEDMYYYGHSFGGEMGHHVALWLKKRYRKKIHRMTLVDPAGPFFLGHPERAIGPEDADLMDCVSTTFTYNLGVPHFVGIFLSVCQRNFYFNGGGEMLRVQPGCFGSLLAWCSHFKSIFLVDASVGYCDYSTVRCKYLANFERQKCSRTDVKFGLREKNDQNREKGIYFLKLARNPYSCKQQNFVK